MEIKEFNKSNLSELKNKINEALKLIGEEYNVTLDIDRITYTSNSFTSKLKCSINDQKINDNRAQHNLSLFCLEDAFNKIIKYRNVEYKITNANISKRKYPIECTRLSDNGKLMFTLDLVKELIK